MKCATINCDETLSPKGQRLYCTNCRSAMYYAEKQGSGWIKIRGAKLKKFSERLTNVRQRKANRNHGN